MNNIQWFKSLPPQKQMGLAIGIGLFFGLITGFLVLTGQMINDPGSLLFMMVYLFVMLAVVVLDLHRWLMYGLYAFAAIAITFQLLSGRFDPTQQLFTLREQWIIGATIISVFFIIGFVRVTNWLVFSLEPRKASEQ